MAQAPKSKGRLLIVDVEEFNLVVFWLFPSFLWLSAVLVLCFVFAVKVLNSSTGNLGPTHFRSLSFALR
jgi:hypothetical protein